MSVYFLKSYIRTADYRGTDRRDDIERRVALDPRRVVRFDKNGGDRRSCFARRSTDEGFRQQDFPEPSVY